MKNGQKSSSLQFLLDVQLLFYFCGWLNRPMLSIKAPVQVWTGAFVFSY
ncbi:hypothetical protein SD78_3478 [Bacillus badius]|nr:hypothetical protein SD78_3478 [Bacillus badius]